MRKIIGERFDEVRDRKARHKAEYYKEKKREVKVLKVIMVIPCLFIVLLAFLLGEGKGDMSKWDDTGYKELREECSPIFHELENEDFDTAKILDNEIVLYDKENLKIKSIPYCSDLSKEILYIENEDTNIRFWHKKVHDDYEGLMFMKSDSNVDVGGMRIRNMQGNAYVYYTSP